MTEFYARADSAYAGALVLTDLAGARLCRPAGYSPSDLIRMGLLPGRVQLIAAPDSETCLKMLDRGEVDVASMDASVTRALVLRVPFDNPLVVLEPLTRINGLRALALRDDPQGLVAISLLNTGLEKLSASGAWYNLVQSYMEQPGG